MDRIFFQYVQGIWVLVMTSVKNVIKGVKLPKYAFVGVFLYFLAKMPIKSLFCTNIVIYPHSYYFHGPNTIFPTPLQVTELVATTPPYIFVFRSASSEETMTRPIKTPIKHILLLWIIIPWWGAWYFFRIKLFSLAQWLCPHHATHHFLSDSQAFTFQ